MATHMAIVCAGRRANGSMHTLDALRVIGADEVAHSSSATITEKDTVDDNQQQ